MITLGWDAIKMTVQLSRDSDFIAALISDEGDWPDDTLIELRFSGEGMAPVAWPADIVGPRATWEMDKDDVAAILTAGATVAKLFYNDMLWAKGVIRDSST